MVSLDKGLLMHVGLPKAASTTLQRTLFSKHSQLFYLGKCVGSAVEKGCLSEDVFKVLKPVLWENMGSFDIVETLRVYRTKILPEVSDNKYLLGSWEALGNRSTKQHLQMLKRIQKVFGRCRIMYVLRNPFTQVPSLYLQNIKGNFIHRNRKWMGASSAIDIDTWFERMAKKTAPREPLNYNRNIQDSFELLRKENVGVFLFEDLVTNPQTFYRGISNFIGIDSDETYALTQQKHHNPRITQGQLDLLRKLDSSFFPRRLLSYCSPGRRDSLLKNMSADTGPVNMDLSPALQERVANSTRDGHRWLIENFDLPLEKYGYPL